MILERIDLKAFGRFTNVSLDLSAEPHRFHLIYGPNESGKSTTLRAITSLLFGMSHRTDDNYLHPNTKMRVGGRIVGAGGEVLECVRRRGRKNTLRDADDNEVIDDQRLDAMLGGVTQDAFLTRFGLSHEELVRGGSEILAGGGELGHLLFAAGAGIGRLRQVSAELEELSGKLFNPRGKKDRINQAVREIDELRRQRREAELPPDEFLTRRRHLDQARSEAERLSETLQRSGAELARLRALSQALPLVPQWRSATEQLAQLESVPLLDDEFSHRRQEAQRDHHTADKYREKLNSDLEQLQQKRQTLGDDAAVLTHQEEIETLFQQLSAREQAKHEHAELIRQQHEADQNMIAWLRELQIEICGGQQRDQTELIDDHVERLRLSESVRSRIDELAGQYEKLVQQRDDAEQEVEALQGKLRDVQSELDGLPVDTDPESLGEVIDAIGSPAALADTLAEQREDRDQLKRRCEELCRQLDGFTGSFTEAAKLRLPDGEKVDRFAEQLRLAEEAHAAAESTLQQLREQCGKANARLEARQSSDPLPTEDQLAEARRQRDHLVDQCAAAPTDSGQGDPPTRIDQLREAVRAADRIADTMRRLHEQVHARAAEQAELQRLEQQREQAAEELAGAKQRWQEAQNQWDQLWHSLGLDAGAPHRMRRLQAEHEQLADCQQRWQVAAGRCEATEQRIRAAADRLRAVLKSLPAESAAASVPAEETPLFSSQDAASDLATLYDEAASVRRKWQQRKQAGEELQRRKEQLTELLCEAKARLKRHSAALQRWTDDWKRAVESFAHRGEVTPAEAKPMIRRVDQLCGEKHQRDERNRKIRSIAEDHQAFDQRVARLLEAMQDDELLGSEPDRAVRRLYQRLGEERSAQQQRQSLDQQLQAVQRQLRENDEQQSRSSAALEQLCEEAGCERPEELPELERRSRERRDRLAEVRGLQARLQDFAAGEPLEQFLEEAAEQQAGAIEVQIQQKEAAIEQIRQQASEAQQRVGELKKELEQIDGSGRASQLQQSIQLKLGEISRDAEQFARTKLASAMLQRAIDHYRREHQGPILAEADRLFRSLTCGEYRALKVDYDTKGQPTLCGVRGGETPAEGNGRASGKERLPAGTEVPAQLMSAGTADALYLAFRLASLGHQLRQGPVIPMVVDDCLIQLDDARAAAALKSLSELSQMTQVILMTHHRHLIDLAAEHLGPGRYHVHHLDAVAAEAQAPAR